MTPTKPTTVDAHSVRLLLWLERYPFQRGEDLVVAMAPWIRRSALYLRLAELETLHFIEHLRLGTRKQALYHLTPAGQAACAFWLGKPEVPPASAREALWRLLPRLPILLAVQDLVNGLVSGTSDALTQRGRRASLIQWDWQRDYVERLGENRDERVLRVEGTLSLRMHFIATSETATRDHWYGFFVLHQPLDDVRLMRQRLVRLTRWRERKQPGDGTALPLVLILATSARQAEWWHLAANQVAHRLHTPLLTGAVTSPPQTREAGWRWTWRRLGMAAPCHLQELLKPGQHPPFDSPTPKPLLHGQADDSRWPLPARTPKSSYRLTGRTSAQDERLLPLVLASRHWEIVYLCFAHPLLSTEDLSAHLPIERKGLRALLRTLDQQGVLRQTETEVGWRWHLSERGLRLLAWQAGCHLARLVHHPIVAGEPVLQRSVKGLLHQARHTAGVYGFFARLAQDLAQVPGARLRWWETGALCERYFVWREQVYRFKPDAFAGVFIGGQTRRFWLEWDRGTMGRKDLETKCATYAAFLTSREWASASAVPPVLICVFPDYAQEFRFTKAARALLAHVPSLRIFSTTVLPFARQGALAAIWRQLLPVPEHPQPVTLFAPSPGNE
jgi:hypothetical protein